jgi:hypothetical protein
LVFDARAGKRDVRGIDLLHLDEDGLIDEITVMVRPLTGLQALAEEMKAALFADSGFNASPRPCWREAAPASAPTSAAGRRASASSNVNARLSDLRQGTLPERCR